jgi:hypothetical protein
LPPSPESLSCASWLVYATRATHESATRVKNLIIQIKTDRVEPATGVPTVRLVVERVALRLGDRVHEGFDGAPMLVPVPGAGLTKPNSVWPARRVCEELVRQGLGVDVLPIVRRTTAVSKSAGNAARPSLEEHLNSLTVQPRLRPPSRVIVVDDVVTSGTTIMGCALKLALTYPGVPVSGFALARVQSAGNPVRVLDPAVERIILDGLRCRRGNG